MYNCFNPNKEHTYGTSYKYHKKFLSEWGKILKGNWTLEAEYFTSTILKIMHEITSNLVLSYKI